MNFSNPTPIKIGMEASFAGKRYRVAGRVVLGVVEDGQMYYWNEYNLETDGGESATLVFEETEDGPEWKMFTMFEPQFAISTADAATKRVGDLINLDGQDCRVTRVDHSLIYYVEGKAPEGEVVNAAADYFNAVEGGKMIVVSWTGGEVECYRGITMPSGMVASAFDLQQGALLRFHLASAGSHVSGAAALVKAMALIVMALIVFAIVADLHSMLRPTAGKTFPAPSASFELSGDGPLNGTEYRIAARAVVEVKEVGWRSQRHEYYLTNEDGAGALIIRGLQPGAKDWVLFTPLHPAEAMTPQQAAEVKAGQIVNVDGLLAAVTDLFRSEVIMPEDPAGESRARRGEVRFGFIGRKNLTWLLVRWNANEIAFYQGTAITEQAIKETFGKEAK